MHPDFPPRVFFNEFNDASLNIIMLYWYNPPTWADYMAQDSRRPLHISLSGDGMPTGQSAPRVPS